MANAQSRRGLAPNTLDAYSRTLERYLGFLDSRCIASSVATRGDVCLYLASFHAGLSNATVQQFLTVVRLFHAYLMEEGVRPNSPVTQTGGGRGMVARHHKLPWVPNEEDWQAILAAARLEPIRNRAMLAFAYDAGLRREELCCLQSSDLDPSRRMLRVRGETTKATTGGTASGLQTNGLAAPTFGRWSAMPRAFMKKGHRIRDESVRHQRIYALLPAYRRGTVRRRESA